MYGVALPQGFDINKVKHFYIQILLFLGFISALQLMTS